MKEYKIESEILDLFPALRKSLKGDAVHQFFIGLDAELKCCAVSIITNGGTPYYFGKRTRDEIVELTRHLISQGHSVALSQEACGFGYEFHRNLSSSGAISLIVATEVLNGKRKTDKADSRKLATDLYSYLELGNKKAIRPIRVPNLDEQQTRALFRERSQCLKVRNQLAGYGRSLARSLEVLDVPSTWYGKRVWPKWKAALQEAGHDWLIARLELKLPLIYQLDEQITQLEADSLQLAFEKDSVNAKADAPQNAKEFEEYIKTMIPKGLGVATHLNINAEVSDWLRFNNRKQVGSYTGGCPSEYSSGTHQRLGAIDRIGNATLRMMLVEAAWRMVRYQPNWRGVKKHYEVLKTGAKASSRQRRIAIVAVARLLAIDLWRLATGVCTLDDLGFVPAA